MANTIVEMKSKEGVLLKTKNTYCEEDIEVKVGFTIPKLAQIQYGESNEILYELAGTYSGQNVEVTTDDPKGDEIKNKDYWLYYKQTYIDNNKMPLYLHINTPVNLQYKNIAPSALAQTVRADSAYDGLGQVTISATPLQTKRVTANGTFTPDTGYLGFSSIEVAVADVDILQEKTVTPNKLTQIIEADSGYDALSKVTIKPIPNEYIIPTGKFEINTNGEFNVSQYATVEIKVPQPSGQKVIDTLASGKIIDVEWFQTLYINIPTYEGLTEDL